MNNQIKVGDIFHLSWGYNQTNVNFFQVTRISAKGVFVREIGYVAVPGSEGFMSQNVLPVKDSFLKDSQWCCKRGLPFEKNIELFRKLKGNGFNIRGRYFAYLWDGKPKYNSWYA